MRARDRGGGRARADVDGVEVVGAVEVVLVRTGGGAIRDVAVEVAGDRGGRVKRAGARGGMGKLVLVLILRGIEVEAEAEGV